MASAVEVEAHDAGELPICGVVEDWADELDLPAFQIFRVSAITSHDWTRIFHG